MKRAPGWTAAIAYTGIVVAMMLPLVLRLGTGVPNDLGDPLLNTWILWWNSEHLPLTTAWWNAGMFFPVPDALAFSEHLAGLSLLTTPVIWLTGNPQLAYNVVFLLTFVLSAMSAYALGWTLTRRHEVAFIVGLAYGFAPYRMAQVAHIQVLAAFWMPLTLAALHLYLEDRRPRWLVLFGVATAMQGMSSGYYLMFFPVLLLLWTLWFLPVGRRLVTAGAIAGAFVAATLPQLPVLLRYKAVHSRQGFERDIHEITSFGANLDDLFRTRADLVLWGRWLEPPHLEADLFPGLTVVLLVLTGLVLGGRRSDGPAEPVKPLLPRWLRTFLAILAGVLSLLALARAVLGPWRFELLGLVISTGRLSKMLSQALYACLIVALTGPGARRIVRSRSPLVFYTGATIAMWILSFGPVVKVGGVETFYWAPYKVLTFLPGFNSVRVPARFVMLATLCLAAGAGLALARIQSRVGRMGQRALVAIAATGILADAWSNVAILEPPEPSIVVAADPPGAVLELPVREPVDIAATYRGMAHRHPIVNGYSGYEPPYHIVLRTALAHREQGVLAELASRGVRQVAVFHDEDPKGRWRKYVAAFPGAREVRSSAGQTLYVLSAPSSPTSCLRAGPSLPVTRLEANVNAEELKKVLDGDPATRWDTGETQRSGIRLVIDLGSARTVAGVELAIGPYYADFPRELVVEGAIERHEWTNLWQGQTGSRAVAAVLEDPRRTPLRVCFPAVETRYLRLRLIGSDPMFHWTVAELAVLGPPAAAPPPPTGPALPTSSPAPSGG